LKDEKEKLPLEKMAALVEEIIAYIFALPKKDQEFAYQYFINLFEGLYFIEMREKNGNSNHR